MNMDRAKNLQETKRQLRLPTENTIENAIIMIDHAGYIICRKLNKETAKMYAPVELLNMVPIFYMNKSCSIPICLWMQTQHSNFY